MRSLLVLVKALTACCIHQRCSEDNKLEDKQSGADRECQEPQLRHRTGWQDLPFELKLMILDHFVDSVVRRTPEHFKHWINGLAIAALYLRYVTKSEDLMVSWSTLHSLVVAIPDMRDAIYASLENYNQKASDRFSEEFQADFLIYREKMVVDEDRERRHQENYRLHINSVALWSLLNTNSNRRMDFWQSYDVLVVERDIIMPWQLKLEMTEPREKL